MTKMNVIFRVLDVMETIDDDCDNMDVVFVAVKVNRQILKLRVKRETKRQN